MTVSSGGFCNDEHRAFLSYVGVLRRLLTHVEDNYCFDTERPNSYHNALHAAFVVQAVGHFMSACGCLLAAACGQVVHPRRVSFLRCESDQWDAA